MEIRPDSIIVLTGVQLRELAEEAARTALEAHTARMESDKGEDEYVFGLEGIEKLFGVSHSVAQKYKNTFLAPAVMQVGRKITIDARHARRLYRAEMARLTNEQGNP